MMHLFLQLDMHCSTHMRLAPGCALLSTPFLGVEKNQLSSSRLGATFLKLDKVSRRCKKLTTLAYALGNDGKALT